MAKQLGSSTPGFRVAGVVRIPEFVAGFAWLAMAAMLSACPAKHRAASGCGKDVDCKGERVCEEGRCVAPAAAPEGEDSVTGPIAAGEQVPASASPPRFFRGGPGQRGLTEAVGPVEPPALVWSVDLGAVVFATPTLADGPEGELTAYVGTHAGRFVGVRVAGEQAGQIDFDLRLGGLIWATAAAAGSGEGLRLYVGNDDDTLYALAPAAEGDARVAWKLRLGECENTRSPGPEGARCDVDGGPTLGPDGDLFVGADGLYRISPAGEIRWHWPESAALNQGDGEDGEGTGGEASDTSRPAHVFSSPVLTADGRVYFGNQDGFVTAVDAADGRQRWQYSVRADVDGSGVIGPDGALFIGADDGRIHALRADGSLRWSFVAQRDIRSSLAIGPDDTIYATSFDGNLYAVGPSGEVRWVLPTGGIVHASPVVDGAGNIFFGSQDDHLYAVSPAGKVLWAIDLGADVDSSVAISETGVLVVGCDDGTLRAYATAP